MSHIVTCKVELKNEGCLLKAADKLGLEHLGNKTHDMYGRQKATGHGFKLPNWQYPVVIGEDGTARYDNYGGSGASRSSSTSSSRSTAPRSRRSRL